MLIILCLSMRFQLKIWSAMSSYFRYKINQWTFWLASILLQSVYIMINLHLCYMYYKYIMFFFLLLQSCKLISCFPFNYSWHTSFWQSILFNIPILNPYFLSMLFFSDISISANCMVVYLSLIGWSKHVRVASALNLIPLIPVYRGECGVKVGLTVSFCVAISINNCCKSVPASLAISPRYFRGLSY